MRNNETVDKVLEAASDYRDAQQQHDKHIDKMLKGNVADMRQWSRENSLLLGFLVGTQDELFKALDALEGKPAEVGTEAALLAGNPAIPQADGGGL